MSKVVPAGIGPSLMRACMVLWRRGQAQAGGGERFTRRFERHDGEPVCEGQQAADRTAERVTRQPDVGVRVDCGDVVVKVLSGVVIAVLLLECFNETGGVAGVG